MDWIGNQCYGFHCMSLGTNPHAAPSREMRKGGAAGWYCNPGNPQLTGAIRRVRSDEG